MPVLSQFELRTRERRQVALFGLILLQFRLQKAAHLKIIPSWNCLSSSIWNRNQNDLELRTHLCWCRGLPQQWDSHGNQRFHGHGSWEWTSWTPEKECSINLYSAASSVVMRTGQKLHFTLFQIGKLLILDWSLSLGGQESQPGQEEPSKSRSLVSRVLKKCHRLPYKSSQVIPTQEISAAS